MFIIYASVIFNMLAPVRPFKPPFGPICETGTTETLDNICLMLPLELQMHCLVFRHMRIIAKSKVVSQQTHRLADKLDFPDSVREEE